MAKLVFGMNQSLDGYVDHTAFGPSPTLFRHFIEEAQGRRAACTAAGCTRSCATGTTTTLNGMQRNAPSRCVAEPAEVGRLALVGVGRPQRHACCGRSRGGGPHAESRARRGARSRRTRPGAEPHRPRPDRRVPDLPAPRRARPRHALLRRPPPPLRLVAHDRIGEDVLRLAYVPANPRLAGGGSAVDVWSWVRPRATGTARSGRDPDDLARTEREALPPHPPGDRPAHPHRRRPRRRSHRPRPARPLTRQRPRRRQRRSDPHGRANSGRRARPRY